METDRLRYFSIIVDTGSLTKAAEVLGVSHSGLSKAMSVLQDELGFKIFSPKGRGLELTDKGKDLYQQSRKILELVNVLKRPVLTLTNSVRIGVPEVLALAIAEYSAKEMVDGLTVDDFDSGELESHVLDRRMDFGFTFVPFPDRNLDHYKISSVTLASFARLGHFESIDPESIPYVVPSSELRENPLSLRIRDGWNANLSRFTPYKANSLSIALKMVQSGQCAIYTPRFLVNYLNQSLTKERQLVELNLSMTRRNKERTQRDVFLVKRANDEETKSMKRIVKIVRQLCKD